MRFLAFLVLMVFVSPAAVAQTNSWDQHRYDETHQGFIPAAVNNVFGAPTVEWWANRSIAATVKASPIYSEGKIFIGGWDSILYALDSESGSELWRYKANAKITGAAAASEATVYVITESGTLSAINAKTGVVERTVSTGATFGSPTVHERRVYVGTNAGTVVAYDGDTLQLVWSFPLAGDYLAQKPTAGRVEGAPTVYNGMVIFGSENQYVYAVDEQGSGDDKTRLVGLYKATGAIRTSPAIDKANNRALFGAMDGKVYSVNLPTSYTNPAANMTAAWTHAQLTETNLPSQIQSSPAIAYGNAYFGANNGNIVAVALSSGIEVWKKTTGGQVVSSPAIANHTVVVGSSDRSLYILNATKGDVLWTKSSSSAIESSPAIHGTQVFWANTDGGLFSWGGSKPMRADLSVVSVAGSLTAGQSGTVTATIKNVGTLASAATEVQFFSTDAKFGAAKLATTEPLEALEPNAQQRISATFVGSGSAVYVRVVVDPANAVKEVDEGNNAKNQKVNVQAAVTETTAAEGGAPSIGPFALMAAIALLAIFVRRRDRR